MNQEYAETVSATASALSGGSTAHAGAGHRAGGSGPANEWLGIVLFIVSEAVMFGAFFAQYFYNRILSDEWPNPLACRPASRTSPRFRCRSS